jgi:hypothetical protein
MFAKFNMQGSQIQHEIFEQDALMKIGMIVSWDFKFGFIGGIHIPFTHQIHQWGRGPMGVSSMLPTIKSLGISMLF